MRDRKAQQEAELETELEQLQEAGQEAELERELEQLQETEQEAEQQTSAGIAAEITSINAREAKRRQFILSGNIFAVILRISLPLILINALTFVYGIIDAMLVQDSQSMASIVVIVQISSMIVTIGSGLASGGVIIISRLIGRNEYETAKQAASTIIALAVIIIVVISAITLPLAVPILRLLRTHESLIAIGTQYFRVQVLVSCVSVFNGIYMGLEKSRGRTLPILIFNICIMATKITLTVVVVLTMEANVTMMALSTLMANLMLTVFIVFRLASRGYMFRFSIKEVRFTKSFLAPIVSLSLPIFIGRFVFTLGKVVINAMCGHYSEKTVGALGASNNMGGFATNVIGSVEESTGQIISANLGNKNQKRALDAFYYSFVFNVGLAVAGVILLTLFSDFIITKLYSKGDAEYAEMISNIFFFEKMGIVALGVNSSVLALLYGFGFTKTSLYINLSRLFVFRIPSLAFFMYLTDLGSESVGMAMMVSNVGIGAMSLCIAAIYLYRIKKYKITDRLRIKS